MARDGKMSSGRIRRLTVTGMLLAIMLLFNVLPIGFIPLPAFNATLMHIPVLVGLFSEGLGVGAVLGLAFGVSSLVKSYVAPTLTSFAFQKPWFSIPPRVIFPVIAWAVAWLVIKAVKALSKSDRAPLHAGRAVGSFVGTLSHTALVLGAMRLFFLNDYAVNVLKLEPTPEVGAAVTTALVATASTQGLAEAAIAGFLVPLICAAIDNAFGRYVKKSATR